MAEEEVLKRLRELETQVALLQQKDKERGKDVEQLQTGIGRVLWAIGGAFLAGIASWVIGGGLVK